MGRHSKVWEQLRDPSLVLSIMMFDDMKPVTLVTNAKHWGIFNRSVKHGLHIIFNTISQRITELLPLNTILGGDIFQPPLPPTPLCEV
jgi:hypothetical protein